jgi:hypothetical protein
MRESVAGSGTEEAAEMVVDVVGTLKVTVA